MSTLDFFDRLLFTVDGYNQSYHTKIDEGYPATLAGLNYAPGKLLGSLSNDLEGLEKILDGAYPPTTIDFHGLGNIFIAIGHKIDRSMGVT